MDGLGRGTLPRVYYYNCYDHLPMEDRLRPEQLKSARTSAGLTQHQAADRMGVSQAYLALLERGRRPLTAQLKSRIVEIYGLGPVALPLDADNPGCSDSSSLAAGLASLGYPGFRQLTGGQPRNPATILLSAVAAADLEVRVLEALPWLAVQYHNLDWEWLIREAKVRDVQNRLGFVVMLARQVAEKSGNVVAAGRLRHIEAILDRARLVREDTLCQESLSEAERRWLRQTRPTEARHWNLLTDLKAQLLPYAA
jgi:transcriptional regulator with XRE-family HTH domain